MTAKEYLNNVRTIDIQLKVKEHRLVKLRQDLCSLSSIDYRKDRVDGGKPVDMSTKIAAIQDLEEKINAEWDELLRIRTEAEDKINCLSDPLHRVILTERYINCKGWDDIKDVLQYRSMRGVMKLHVKALKEFESVHLCSLKFI